MSGKAYHYLGIKTNNLLFINQEVIKFINQEVESENYNKFLISDFSLKNLYFMNLDTNTVFTYLMPICSILFEWTKIILVKNKIPNISIKMRVKAIYFRYITTASNFVCYKKEKILQVFSTQESMSFP